MAAVGYEDQSNTSRQIFSILYLCNKFYAVSWSNFVRILHLIALITIQCTAYKNHYLLVHFYTGPEK